MAVPRPSRRQSSNAQPNSWTIGARNKEGSAVLPVITTSAPVASASTMPSAPR